MKNIEHHSDDSRYKSPPIYYKLFFCFKFLAMFYLDDEISSLINSLTNDEQLF